MKNRRFLLVSVIFLVVALAGIICGVWFAIRFERRLSDGITRAVVEAAQALQDFMRDFTLEGL